MTPEQEADIDAVWDRIEKQGKKNPKKKSLGVVKKAEFREEDHPRDGGKFQHDQCG